MLQIGHFNGLLQVTNVGGESAPSSTTTIEMGSEEDDDCHFSS